MFCQKHEKEEEFLLSIQVTAIPCRSKTVNKLSAYLHVVCKTSVGFDLWTTDWLRGADRCRAANACIIIAQKRSRLETSSLKFCKKRWSEKKFNQISCPRACKTIYIFFGKHFSSLGKQTFNLTLWIADLLAKFAVERNSYKRREMKLAWKGFFSLTLMHSNYGYFWSFAI